MTAGPDEVRGSAPRAAVEGLLGEHLVLGPAADDEIAAIARHGDRRQRRMLFR